MFRIFFTFFKIGLFTFGGGYSMIPLIHYYAVDKYKWIGEKEFIDIIAIAESTPGPIAINSATYVGYKTKKTLGSLMATLGVVLPSLIIITIISAFLMQFKENQIVEYAFMGIRIGVAVLILNASIRIYKKVDKSILTYVLAMFGFFMALFDVIPIVFIILIGGILGIFYVVFIQKSEVNKDD
ncbi:chromate transporter [Candidatus Izemoplasma sp. B36]|uniref:chromate transporter n=1 Tax=Candidatus Izemoplasma sp. B36 TaxID=3242468 RepID=UPI003556C36B